jgi:hypothetical protein
MPSFEESRSQQMTLPGFVILIVLAVIAVSIFLELAAIPGAKARERGHPQADAINILGWFGLLMGGAPWVGALVWAYTRPGLLVEPAANLQAEDAPSAASTAASETTP